MFFKQNLAFFFFTLDHTKLRGNCLVYGSHCANVNAQLLPKGSEVGFNTFLFKFSSQFTQMGSKGFKEGFSQHYKC